MAGKKQHHIPQSVQRGFLFEAKAEKTYVYRRNGGTFPKSISDVAAQRFFYSQLSSDGNKTLDDEITDYESRLGDLLIKLRSTSIGAAVDACLAAEVVAHLTPRTANMRRILRNGMQQLMTAAAEAFANEDTMFHMLGLMEPEPNSVWNERIRDRLEENQNLQNILELLPLPKTLLDRLIFMAAKEHFLGTFDTTSYGIVQGFTQVLEGLDHMVRDAHNGALAREVISEPRRTMLEGLEWYIHAAPPEGALLPDCIALGVEEGEETFLPYMMTKATAVSSVIMPITSEKILVGIRPGNATPDLTNFNRHGAACSEELFISASQSPVFAELHAQMGTSWSSEIDAAVQSTLEEVFPRREAPIKDSTAQPAVSQLSYQLTFSGYGDIDIAPISEKTQRIIEKVLPLFDLSRLDGITFAAPFQQAIDGLERGFDISTAPEGEADDLAQGASAAIVLRDGIPKVRIILNAEYGLSLVGQEQRDAEVALHLLIAGLVQACTIAQIEKSLPDFLMMPVMMNDHDGMLHCAIRKALRSYRYAHDSAGFGADELVEQEFTRYAVETFNSATEIIKKAKEDHAVNKDFYALFEAAHSAACNILISIARLVGHRHGVGQFEVPAMDTEIGAIIASYQLTNWVEVFGKDLWRFWQKEVWKRVDFYALNIHVERILWANGIVLWKGEDGNTMIMAIPKNA